MQKLPPCDLKHINKVGQAAYIKLRRGVCAVSVTGTSTASECHNRALREKNLVTAAGTGRHTQQAQTVVALISHHIQIWSHSTNLHETRTYSYGYYANKNEIMRVEKLQQTVR